MRKSITDVKTKVNSFKQYIEVSADGPPAGGSYRRGQYWGDSAAGILIVSKDTKKLLANARSDAVDSGSCFGIYGGGLWLDKGETFQNINPALIAIHELKEETGYSGQISEIELLYDFHDKKVDWHYWSYLGVVPKEFPLTHGWESEGGSGWYTWEEFMDLRPKHPGLQKMLSRSVNRIVAKLGET